MKPIIHYNAKSVADAATLLQNNPNSAAIAGGTDLLHIMRQNCITQPDVLVNLKTIPNLSYIKEEGGVLKIGANTTLATIAASATVQGNYKALAQAAGRVASPLIRNQGTIAGNLCQDVWCWYYRGTDNNFNCIRKGGSICYATAGDNKYYHSIFGGPKGCYSIHPSDTAVALVALNASVVTSSRTMTIDKLFQEAAPGNTLAQGEIISEIQVPTPTAGSKSAFMKFSLRSSIDFALVSAAVWYNASGGTVSDSRIVMGGVYQTPRRATAAETYLKGKALDATSAAGAGAQAVSDATAMSQNAYKKSAVAAMIKRALLA